MAKASAAAPKPKSSSGLPAFTFQFEEPRCRGVLISSLKNQDPIRPIWSLSVINKSGGGEVGTVMQRMPAIPGLNVVVIPKEKKVAFEDPLATDQDLVDRINAVMAEYSSIAPAGGKSIKAVPRWEVSLDDDGFKTLMLELWYYNSPESQMELLMIKGVFPTMDQIDQLPGRQLYDVRSNSHIQPRYRDDLQEYYERLVFSSN